MDDASTAAEKNTIGCALHRERSSFAAPNRPRAGGYVGFSPETPDVVEALRAEVRCGSD